MAILRGGRRIGNFDIRVGLPRDKSLVDIAKDPRLQRQPGGSGQIQRFQSQINQGEGFAAPNRYLIVIHPPERLVLEGENPPERRRDDDVNELKSSQIRENVALMCNAITLPTRDVNTVDHRMYGPGRKMPYAYSFNGTIECSFYGDKFLRQRLFFENWQKGIMNIENHNMRYYDDYVGSIDIFTLGQFDSKQVQPNAIDLKVDKIFEINQQSNFLINEDEKMHRGSLEMHPDENDDWHLDVGT